MISKSKTLGLISILLAGATSPLMADQQINALEGIGRVESRHGEKFVGRIVEMKGEDGQAQPEEWELIVYDPSNEYLLREFWIGDTRATNEGINYDYYPKDQPPGFISLHRLKIDSPAAFRILDREAQKAQIGFDSIDYHLRCREFSDEPIWTLKAKDEDGYQVARIDLSAETGRVYRTVWSYREGRKVPRIKDSALSKRRHAELDLRDEEPTLHKRHEDEEVIGPRIRKEPEVPAPIDPAPVGDPGTEEPEVVPVPLEDE